MNKQEKQTQKSRTQTIGKSDVTVGKGKGSQIYDDGRLFDFGWWAHNAKYRSCILEMYT